MVKCVLGFCYDCPSKKVSQKFLQISVEKMREFFLFFALKKSLSGTETMARRIFSRLNQTATVDVAASGRDLDGHLISIPSQQIGT